MLFRIPYTQLLIVGGVLFFSQATAVQATSGVAQIFGAAQLIDVTLPVELIGDMARANLDADPELETVYVGGIAQRPLVMVLDDDGTPIAQFLAYQETLGTGLHVALGDVNGDGALEIVTVPQQGGGPHVRVFSQDGTVLASFFAYDESLRSGLEVTTGDFNGDGQEEIATIPSGNVDPHLRIFSLQGTLLQQTYAFSSHEEGETYTLTHLASPDHSDTLLVGKQQANTLLVRTAASATHALNWTSELTLPLPNQVRTARLFPLNDRVFGVAASDDQTAYVDLYTQTGLSAFTQTYPLTNPANLVVAGTSALDLLSLFLPASSSQSPEPLIRVDLSEQRLYAYEDGHLVQTFLISAARAPFTTPQGTFHVLRKLRWHDYRWNYGVGDARNYFIPNVEYNLEFVSHFYIHHAYWHRNWGTPMSHGCVNAPYEGVQWLFNWADVGTTVFIHA